MGDIMPKYNLNALGSEEFERMCQSLVQQIMGPEVKVYGMGKDGAREATFEGEADYPSKDKKWSGKWIFQSKFHDTVQIGPKKARDQLLSDLDDELSKITEYGHDCDYYILMTNVVLTPVFQAGTKDKIDNEIAPKYENIKKIHVWGADEICRFLDSHVDIRQSYYQFLVTGDIISVLIKLANKEKTDLDETIQLYCHSCFIREKYAHLDDADDVDEERIELQRVFVDLDVDPPCLPHDPKLLESLPNWLIQASEDENRNSALSYLLDDSLLGLVIVGGPGEGKSTLGQYLAQIYRARLINKISELSEETEEFESCMPRIPYRILLKEYAQWISSNGGTGNLFKYLSIVISEASGREITSETVQKVIKSNPTILILDGLDEVPKKELRTIVLDNINSFVNQTIDVFQADLKVIATTRPHGYSEEFNPNHYLHLNLKGLSQEKATYYAQLWTQARQQDDKEAKRILDVFAMCLEDKVVNILTKTALQVTILLVIIYARGTPPKQKEELFDKYMDIIYLREHKKRTELLKSEKDIIYGLHKKLGFILHSRSEMDETEALMDVSEFKEQVKKYLKHSDPLSNEIELESEAERIKTEVSERLVLIESPQEDKVGFSLTSIREFFAAAYLVDTAKTSINRDMRFKTISRSPHWRNVALFYSGRIGRLLPGEAPSIINVCQEIDTEEIDTHIKRGAELVMEILDDRALREPRDFLGAIQYVLSLLDNNLFQPFIFEGISNVYFDGYYEFLFKLSDQMNNFPEKHKERFLRPKLEEKLINSSPENLGLCIDLYESLFGVNDTLQNALKKLAGSDSNNIQLWAVSKAINYEIQEAWVVETLENLLDAVPIKKICSDLTPKFFNFEKYLNFPISNSIQNLIIRTGFMNIIRLRGPYGFRQIYRKKDNYEEFLSRLENISPNAQIVENSMIFWALSLLFRSILPSYNTFLKRSRRNYLLFELPLIVNPKFNEIISDNSDDLDELLNFLDGYPVNPSLFHLYNYIVDPTNIEKYLELFNGINYNDFEFRNLLSILGLYPKNKKFELYHKDICVLYELYDSESAYIKDIKEINKIMNQDSKIYNHVYKLQQWIRSDFDEQIEDFLDKEILNDIFIWLKDRNLSKNILKTSLPIMDYNSNLVNFAIELLEKQLLAESKSIYLIESFDFYNWDEHDGQHESKTKNRLKNAFNTFLLSYDSLNDPNFKNLRTLLGAVIKANVIEEHHMVKVYNIIHDKIDHKSNILFLRIEDNKNAYSKLFNFLESEKIESVKLAAAIFSTNFYLKQFDDIEEEQKIRELLWELSKDKEDKWYLLYLSGISNYTLNWAEMSDEVLSCIGNANNEEISIWCRILTQAGYNDNNGREALLKLILQIIEFESPFSEEIKLAALVRLKEIATDEGPVIFERDC